jgi:uncharacterized membrane protein HdeD (DUF308 family)
MMERQMRGHAHEIRLGAEQMARWWWLWLVMGTLWIIASLIILQFQFVSLVTVGVVIGILFLFAGVQEIFMASLAQNWRWLRMAIGMLLIIAGIFALLNPIHTFLVVADLLAFLFVLVGIFWTIEAVASRGVNDLWYLGVLAGIVLVILGFWTGGHFFATRASILLIFVAIWTLCHGVTDLIQAFRIKQQVRQREARTVG